MHPVRLIRELARGIARVMRAETTTHLRLRERLATVFAATLVVDAAGSVAIYFLERNQHGTDITTVEQAAFWTTAQLLTVSSNYRNPISSGARWVDIGLELWAISVVTALAGSFGAFFHRRGMELDRDADVTAPGS